jgi:hypothetical protein
MVDVSILLQTVVRASFSVVHGRSGGEEVGDGAAGFIQAFLQVIRATALDSR